MQISPRILRLALLQVFADAGEQRILGLSITDISRCWLGTGLRGSDLRDAIHEMMESGDLHSFVRDEVICFTLGTDAHQSLFHPEGELQRASIEEESLLLQAHFRPHQAPATSRHRRLDDTKH